MRYVYCAVDREISLRFVGTYRPPLVVSISYGYDEYGYDASFYPGYMTWMSRQCYEYMKLGLAGTSVLFSSGDHGKFLFSVLTLLYATD